MDYLDKSYNFGLFDLKMTIIMISDSDMPSYTGIGIHHLSRYCIHSDLNAWWGRCIKNRM